MKKSQEELERMSANGDKEAMEELLHHKIRNHSDIRKMKIYLRRIVTIFVVIAVAIIGFLLWFFIGGSAKKITDMQIDAARYSLFKNPVEYQILEDDISKIVESISKKSYKYTKKYSEKINQKQIGQYVSLLCFYKIRYDINPYLMMSITASESEFDPTKISKKYAYGLNQLIKPTYREVNWRMNKANGDIMDVYNNTDAALYYIYDVSKSLCEEFGLEKLTLRQISVAYNGGIKRAYNAIAYNQYDNQILPLETIEYADKVQFYFTNYTKGKFDVWYYEKDYLKTNS